MNLKLIFRELIKLKVLNFSCLTISFVLFPTLDLHKLVKKARHLNDYIIEFTFNNREIKAVNLFDKLNKPVFEPLKNISFFKKFRMNPFTIEWENGADFSPDYLYRLAKEQESKVLSGIDD